MNAALELAIRHGFASREPAEHYHSSEGTSISRLKELQKSGLHYQFRLDNPKESKSMKLGTAAHCATLEPERFTREFVIWSRRSEAGNLCPRKGQFWDAFVAENPGKDILSEEEHTTALTIANAVHGDPLAFAYLETGEPEVSMRWKMTIDSAFHGPVEIECRARADWLHRRGKEHYVVGLKTARDVRGYFFGAAAFKLGYHMQWAWYRRGYFILTGVYPRMKEIVVESDDPYDVVVYDIPEDVLAQGEQDFEALLRHLVDCERRDEWLGIGQGKEQILTLPTYAYDKLDDISDLGLEA